jgi:hypothetical protein
MRYEPLKRRLGKLEVGATTADAVLHFADASTRAVKVKHPLSMFCAACARIHFFLASNPSPDSPLTVEPKLELVKPVSPYDELIDLFGRAVDIESDNRFLFWIAGICQDARIEAEKAENLRSGAA